MYKLIVFIPKEAKESFKEKLFQLGAGKLGNYSHCSFETKGLGQFLPLENANPSVGETHRLEVVEEYRLEFLVESSFMERIIKAIYEYHPYEEPAFDIIELANSKFAGLIKS